MIHLWCFNQIPLIYLKVTNFCLHPSSCIYWKPWEISVKKILSSKQYTVCSDECWSSIFLIWKKYMLLTPEFKYKPSGILSFFLHNHSPKWFFQKPTCLVLKNEKYSLIWQNYKGDFGSDYMERNQVYHVICV